MNSKAKVIPFNNDDLKVEEFKQIDEKNSNDKNKNGNYTQGIQNFMKKRDENKANTGKNEVQFKTNTKNGRSPSPESSGQPVLNGGTGGQDLNASAKSESSISTKTGGDDYMNDNVIEDVRVGNMLLNQIKISEWMWNYFALTTIFAGIIEYELSLNFSNSELISSIRSSLLSLWMIWSFFSIGSIISRYDLVLRWKRSTNQLTRYDNLINTGWWK